MASEGERKDQGRSEIKSILGNDEETWDAALDEWDKNLVLPDDNLKRGFDISPSTFSSASLAEDSPAEDSLPFAESSSFSEPIAGHLDPLVNFMNGEVEIPTEPGEALGSLLGGVFDDVVSSSVIDGSPAVEEFTTDIGINPEEVISADPAEIAEIEVVGAVDVPLIIPEQNQSLISFPEPLDELPETNAVILQQSEAQLTEKEKLNLDVILEDIESIGGQELSPPTNAAKSIQLQTTPLNGEVAPTITNAQLDTGFVPPPLDIFDEILSSETSLIPDSIGKDIEAGEMLPSFRGKFEESPLVPLPTRLADHELEEPELEPIPIPERLLQLDLSQIQVDNHKEPLFYSQPSWEQLIEQLQTELAATEEREHAAEIEFLIARIWEEIDEEKEALHHYREALNFRPGHLPSILALKRLYLHRREFDALGNLLETLIAQEESTISDALRIMRAELLWSQLGDDLRARNLLNEVADSSAFGLHHQLLLADISASSHSEAEFINAITNTADNLNDSRMASTLFLERGRFEEALAQKERAGTSYRKAWAADINNYGALEGLLRITDPRHDPTDFILALRNSGVRSGIWGARRRRRAAILASFYHLQDVNVVEELSQASALAPMDTFILESLAEAKRTAKDFAGAIDGYSILAKIIPTPEHQALVLIEAGLIAEDNLKDLTRAAHLYAEADGILPGFRPATLNQINLGLLNADPEKQLEACRAAVRATTGGMRARFHLLAAKILSENLHRDEEAIAELSLYLASNPFCYLGLAHLERLCRRVNSIERLAGIFETIAEQVSDTTYQADVFHRVAILNEGPLKLPEIALKHYRNILHLQPECSFARWGAIRCFVHLGYHDDLAEELSFAAAATSNAAQSASLWARCGDVLLAEGRFEEAKASFNMALNKETNYLPAEWPLLIWEATHGKWRDGTARWESMAESLPRDSSQRKAYWVRVGLRQARELDQPLLAAESFERAGSPFLSDLPGFDSEIHRVFRMLGNTERIIQELDLELNRTTDAFTRFSLQITIGELMAQTEEKWKEAENRFKAALIQAPEHPVALLNLEQLYSSHAMWQPLVDLLLLNTTDSDTQTMVTSFDRLANLDLERGEDDSACRRYEMLIQADTKYPNIYALRFLFQYHLIHGHWAELTHYLKLEAERSWSNEDNSALWFELGRLLESYPAGEAEHPSNQDSLPAHQLELAHSAYLAALNSKPDSIMILTRLIETAGTAPESVREDLGQLYLKLARAIPYKRDAAVCFVRAGELLQEKAFASYKEALDQWPDFLTPIYRLRNSALKAEAWEDATSSAEAGGRASQVVENKVASFVLAGEIARLKLYDLERSKKAYQQALALDPTNQQAFEQLFDILSNNQQWEDLADLLSERIPMESSNAILAEIHQNLAYLFKDKLNDRTRAKHELRQLIELQQGDTSTALIQLAEMYFEDEEWLEASTALLQIARQEKNPETLRDIFLRMGHIFGDKLKDNKRAIASFNKVISVEATCLEAWEKLMDLYLEEKDFPRALHAGTQLYNHDPDPERKTAHMLRIAHLYENTNDIQQAVISYRQALELAPADLQAIGEMADFFIRHDDQRSLMIHLDRSVATMEARLKHDPFDVYAYRGLFKIFTWRKAFDACLCAAQILKALGHAEGEEQKFYDSHVAAVGSPGECLGNPEYDDWVFQKNIPGGFRQIFQMLVEPFAKIFAGDLKNYNLSRGDRINNIDHPIRKVGDVLAKDFGVPAYEIYLLKSKPFLLTVQNTSPPSIIIGAGLLDKATPQELQFIMGRSLWLIRKAMVLPSRLRPEDLEILVAAVIRQYSSEYQPINADIKLLQEITKQVTRTIPRKLRQELMPFALECSGPTIELRALGAAVIHSANRAGLLTSRSISAALSCLSKMTDNDRKKTSKNEEKDLELCDNPEIEELLRFAISDVHFELRRAMHISIR